MTQNERNITSFLTIDSLVLPDTGYYHCSTSNEAASGTDVFSDRTEAAYLFVQCKGFTLFLTLVKILFSLSIPLSSLSPSFLFLSI